MGIGLRIERGKGGCLMKLALEVISLQEAQRIHEASLQVLSNTGMVFESDALLKGLAAAGARVEAGIGKVLFPPTLVEAAIENTRKLLSSGRRLHLLNGVTSERGEGGGVRAKLSGGCEQYLDWDSQRLMPASAAELLRCVRLGDLIPEVDFVGNPLVMRSGMDGKPLEERMRRIRTAALVARHTRKVGSMEVWNEREIDFLVEIGIIARGSREAFEASPCLVTAKETISPLFLDWNAGDILLALARRKLPCTVIPMPIAGMSAPVAPLGSVVVGNAEILGTMAAIQSVCPDALVGGGIISGVMDMRTATASFSAPEAVLQDIAVAEVHRKLYGLDCLIGTGYTDARYPGSQVPVEKLMKYLLGYLAGHSAYPVGLLNAGSVFSAEQALVDLELCSFIHGQFETRLDTSVLAKIVEVIHEAGVRGNVLGSTHTLDHFRDLWNPLLFDRSSFSTLEESRMRDVYERAHERCEALLGAGGFWEMELAQAREIEAIVRSADAVL
jgi:trimethylamine--corrinoid protein Co-methyltransferase